MTNSKLLTIIALVLSLILFIIILLILAPYLSGLTGNGEAQTPVGYSTETVRAKVLAVKETGQAEVLGQMQTYQVLEIQVLEGHYHMSRLLLEVGKSQLLPNDYLLSPGEIVLVNVGENQADGRMVAFFVDFVRENAIFLLFVFFAIVVLLIGGWTGLRSLFGSLVGLLIIILLVIPGILKGGNPLEISIIGSAIFLCLSFYITYGWKSMTHAAVLGMAIALLLTALFSTIAVRLTRLSGFGDENMMFLIQQSNQVLDIRGILLAGIIIGSLGVLDDLVVGQSSAVFQLSASNSELSITDLFHRAMVIGRDHVSASVNTLLLAYAGQSLPMLLLFRVTNVNYGQALNVGYIAEEIVRALAGTTGLFLALPIATLLACLWVKRKSLILAIKPPQ